MMTDVYDPRGNPIKQRPGCLSEMFGFTTCYSGFMSDEIIVTDDYLKASKYEVQKPSTCRATLFRCKFLSTFPVFHLA